MWFQSIKAGTLESIFVNVMWYVNMKILTEQEAKTIPLDEYCEWMLVNGYYDVDDEGNVYNPRKNTRLTPVINSQGYPVVKLVFNRKVVRQVRIHRLVCIKAYGASYLKGNQIAHLDGTRTNNHLSNLWVTDAKSHVYYDRTHENLTSPKPKQTWEPCSYCNDNDGKSVSVTPDRISGKRFGIDGKICRRCYAMFQERQRRELNGSSEGNRTGRRVIDS